MTPKGILIAEDEPMTRLGIRVLLERFPDEFSVLGEASTGQQAIQLSNTLHPDLIIMDIRLPELNGLEATRQIIAAHPEIFVLILSFADDQNILYTALSNGARGYVLKGADQEETLHAIRSVCNGQAVFSRAIAERVLSFFGSVQNQSDAMFPLSRRESEILSIMAHTSERDDIVDVIADKLTISRHTVQNHISNILTKLQVATRDEAVKQRLEWEKTHNSLKKSDGPKRY